MLILISSDNYLMFGLKKLFPSLVHICEVNKVDQDCVLLIDNRESLQSLFHAHGHISAFTKKFTTIRLDMDQKESALIFSSKSKLISMKQEITGVHFNIIERLNKPQCYSESMMDLTVNETFKSILNYFLSGVSIDDISEILSCSQKTIYRYRYEVSKQMGYRNFYHACIYIFKNNLMVENVVLPQDWVT